MFKTTLHNISERTFIASCLKAFRPILRISTIEWSKRYRHISSAETSFGVGKFDPDHTPYMEYVYECLDNSYIPVICAQKSARIGWTETINNYRGRRIHTQPCNMLLGFPIKEDARTFGKEKFKWFLENTPILSKIVDVGVSENKKSIFDYAFNGGSLKLRTLGSIGSLKSNNVPYVEIEEPDDVKDNIGGQGDVLENLKQRQKLVPITMKKLIFGGTPTHLDFSMVEAAIKVSNQLVFKAECHECKELIPMDGSSFDCLRYSEYGERKIDDIYGKNDPNSTKFWCSGCGVEWTFAQKNLNIRAGKKHGFVDHTGNFSKGWHAKKPEVTDTFGFIFSELLSPFDGSNFVELGKKRILAELDLAKGKEGLMKSFFNNTRGMPYASGVSSLSAQEMRKLRSNYPEGIVPSDGLLLSIGIDVQHNRFAYVVRAYGRNGNSWLVTWREVFGNVLNYQDSVWQELTNIVLAEYPHASGKSLKITCGSIDSADGSTTELVYRWVLAINQVSGYEHVFATKGSDDLRFSHDEIYNEPTEFDTISYKQVRRTLAETMGVKVYNIGAHKAHNEVLRRIGLNLIDGCNQDRYFFNEQSYGMYEEQITSCRKLIDARSGTQREVFKLISGKRKEAIDCEKMCLHAFIAIGGREFTSTHWKAIEDYLYE